MEPKIIGKRIQMLMEQEKINKKDLAKELNITQIELEKKLNGKEEFYIGEIAKIKKIFNLELDIFAELFFTEDFNTNKRQSKIYK